MPVDASKKVEKLRQLLAEERTPAIDVHQVAFMVAVVEKIHSLQVKMESTDSLIHCINDIIL